MSLKVWLPLNGDLKNQGCTGYTITAIEASPTFTTGKIGQCYQRANTSSQITNGLQIQDNLVSTFGTTASVAVWVKPLGTHTHYNGTILSSGDWNKKRWAFGVSQDNSQVDVLCGGYNNYISCPVPVNQWTHLVSTFENGVCKLYKNGVYVGEKSGQAAFDSDANWTGICRETYAGGYFGFNGCINDLRIYDHALSAAEVKEISQGLVLHYKLDSIGPSMGNPNLLLDGMTPTAAGNGATGIVRSIEDGIQKVVADNPNSNWCTFGNHNTTLALTKGDTFTFSLMIRSPDSNKKPTVYFQSGLGYYGMQGTMSNNWSIIYYTGTWSIDNLQTNIHLGFSSAPGTYYIKYFKLEKGNAVTPWAPKSGESLSNLNYIEDSSGYNNNGTINGNIIISSDTNRYNYSTQFDGVDDSITVPYNAICPENIFTFNLWFKKDALGSKNYETLFGGPSGFEMDTRAGSATTLSLYMASTRSTKRNLVTELSLGNWYMITMTRDGTKEKYYVNGIYQSEIDAKAMPTGVYRIGAWASNTGQNYYGLISDFRIYCTALSADDILQLYHTGAKIDNKANFHAFEINENGTNKLTKTGIMYDNMEESIMTLPDGSHWQLLMLHYVDDGKNLFTSSNANNCNDFGLFSRLKDIDGFKLNSQYEFYAIQDGTAYRWIQTNAPLTTTAVSGFSAVSGYNSPGAGICKCNGNTLLARTNTTSNWWNAFGCYTLYSGGIPGLNSVVCKKYLALYARIKKADVKLSNQTANVSEFIEL